MEWAEKRKKRQVESPIQPHKKKWKKNVQNVFIMINEVGYRIIVNIRSLILTEWSNFWHCAKLKRGVY